MNIKNVVLDEATKNRFAQELSTLLINLIKGKNQFRIVDSTESEFIVGSCGTFLSINENACAIQNRFYVKEGLYHIPTIVLFPLMNADNYLKIYHEKKFLNDIFNLPTEEKIPCDVIFIDMPCNKAKTIRQEWMLRVEIE